MKMAGGDLPEEKLILTTTVLHPMKTETGESSVERLISTVPVWILTVHPGGVWKAEKSIQIITELPRMSMVGGISVMEK